MMIVLLALPCLLLHLRHDHLCILHATLHSKSIPCSCPNPECVSVPCFLSQEAHACNHRFTRPFHSACFRNYYR
ncbi:hypothetical protein KP509_13G059300 [Ceratopteris richardii]|uniref:Secreted protein n=1 Tax=Ceratopteris richardii TaxID=49495 RepID=A0A8T2TFZ4_CERRI|nr:hypothetical protein KP509_13G059300 [Ceratopteris richardii]